ncbi:MAG: PhnD/SsuA/transferrin family substrate-binding protein, partial [Bacillota bacterium]
MKMNKSLISVLTMILFSSSICFGFFEDAYAQGSGEKQVIEIGSLKGPTTMGMVKLMNDSESGSTEESYHVSMYGTADEIVTGIVSGKLNIAAVPCNLSSVLYNKTKGQINVAAINTLGVLYIVETGDMIHSVADLKGKTIYSTGKGTTPEFALNYVLSKNGLDPETDVNIEYKSESTETVALLEQGDSRIALLPQPYVTAVQMKN